MAAKTMYRVSFNGSGTAKGQYREVMLVAGDEDEAKEIASKRLEENHPEPTGDEHALQLAAETFSAGQEPSQGALEARAQLFYTTPQKLYRFSKIEDLGEVEVDE